MLSRTLIALILAFAGAGMRTAALETEDLRIGMTAAEAASVFTSLRSCANYQLEEAPNILAWEALLFGHEARAEITFFEGRAIMVVLRIFVTGGDKGGSLFDGLVASKEASLGSPRRRDASFAEWGREGVVTAMERIPAPLGEEIRILQSLSKGE